MGLRYRKRYAWALTDSMDANKGSCPITSFRASTTASVRRWTGIIAKSRASSRAARCESTNSMCFCADLRSRPSTADSSRKCSVVVMRSRSSALLPLGLCAKVDTVPTM